MHNKAKAMDKRAKVTGTYNNMTKILKSRGKSNSQRNRENIVNKQDTYSSTSHVKRVTFIQLR